MNALSSLSMTEIGHSLASTRISAGLSQDKAAELIDVSRPTFVAIEKGTRPVKLEEIQTLAHHYGYTVNAILRREAVFANLIPRFEKLHDAEDEHSQEAVQLMNRLFRSEVELENVLGIERAGNFPLERSISAGDVFELADQHSMELREHLKLDNKPISDIFSLIKQELGIRLYQCRLSPKSKVSGLYGYDQKYGAYILLNLNHEVTRRVHSAAHKIAQFIGAREQPVVEKLGKDDQRNSRSERYTSRFARTFLMPPDSFASAFSLYIEGSDRVTRRIVIELANQFNVSRQACILHLEELKLVTKGTWEWFSSNEGMTNEQVKPVLMNEDIFDDEKVLEIHPQIPYRICRMAHAAWKQMLMSEGHLTSLLDLGRIELRKILDEIELEGIDPNVISKFEN